MRDNVLGKRLKELRKKGGKTQKDFADALHVTSSAVSKWENGQNMPDIETMREIAGYYGIPLSELVAEASQEIKEGKRENKWKWKAAGFLAGGGIIVVFLGIIVFTVWRLNKAVYTFEIVAERYVEDADWGEVYEVSIFYTGDFTDENIEEMKDELMRRWQKGDLCDASIEIIKVIYNADKSMAKSFDSDSETTVFFYFPYILAH